MKRFLITIMAAIVSAAAANADNLTADNYSKWNVTLPVSDYDITVDIQSMTLNIAAVGIPPTEPTEPTDQPTEQPVTTSTLYMIGTAVGGWTWGTNDVCMNYDAQNGVFTYDGHLATGELKFFTEQSYDNPGIVAYIDANNCHNDQLMNFTKGSTYALAQQSNGHDHKFYVTEGDYRFTVNLANNTIAIEADAVHYDAPHPLYMIGTAVGGWAWGFNDIEMNWDSHNGIYTYNGHLYNGELKFFAEQSYDKPGIVAYIDASSCHNDQLMDFTMGNTYALTQQSDGHDHKFSVTEGDYSFSVNLRDNTVTVYDYQRAKAITGISMVSDTNSADATVYTTNGMRMASLRRGINIIRMSDGTVRKVICPVQ